MTSKIVVNNIESDSGINTVTIIGDVSVGSSITATDITATHHGSGADLTNLPAANLTGTLPAISGANLTGINTAFGSGTSINTSGIITATAFVPSQGQLSHRNIIVNGDMRIAQRATSSTAVGYKTVDRIYGGYAGTDEAPTFTQADIGTSDSPYLSGFRKSFKIQNGNQTSGAGAADELFMTYNIEAQDLAQSGWDYTSSSSNITISFWVKSSVAQQFQVNMRLYPASGDQKEFCFEYTPSANTWTKVTKTIPGASGNVLRNTNELGMFIQFPQFYGSNYTANSRPFDTWETKNNSQNYKDYATTWYTTNDATWEITGLQLEVGPVATPFEHRTIGEELTRCQRYYQKSYSGDVVGFTGIPLASSGSALGIAKFTTEMRAAPTITLRDGTGALGKATQHGNNYLDATAGGIQTNGFRSVARTSGNWSSNAQQMVQAGYFAEAEI
tara:strand:- start:170 stop:1504 length:1335 start_codon:yes stop_codon:yes gene_type:complete